MTGSFARSGRSMVVTGSVRRQVGLGLLSSSVPEGRGAEVIHRSWTPGSMLSGASTRVGSDLGLEQLLDRELPDQAALRGKALLNCEDDLPGAKGQEIG